MKGRGWFGQLNIWWLPLALMACSAEAAVVRCNNSVLTVGDRRLAPRTAPAGGLTLVAVEYGEDGRGHKRHLLHQPAAGQG